MPDHPPPRCWGIVPAAGVGKRMGSATPKQYLTIAGKPVLQHTLERLLGVERIAAVVVALGPEDGYWPDLSFAEHPRIRTAPGGRERADSVLSGLLSLRGEAGDHDWVLVHDAARCCITVGDVEHLIDQLINDPIGGILALPCTDTLKSVDGADITATVDRKRIWRALTPQMFRYGQLRDALSSAAGRADITDEASAIELAGDRPKVVEGRPDNIKITRPEDLPLAAFYLEQQCHE